MGVAHLADEVASGNGLYCHVGGQRVGRCDIDGLFGTVDGSNDHHYLATPRNLDALAGFDAADNRS